MAIPNKYSHIDFTPPKGVREAAGRGLELRREFGRGGTAVGIARARDLQNGVRLSADTVKRMVSFFARHAGNRRDGWGDPSNPSNGYIAHMLWGGDAGEAWANKVKDQMDVADGIKPAVKSVSAGSERVWYVNRTAVKAIEGTKGKVGGYLVAFGLPKDQHGEYFNKDTNFHLDWYPTRPVLFHHGMDDEHGATHIGYLTKLEYHPNGLWAEAEIDLTNPLGSRVYELVSRGELGWSSGSIPHLVKSDPDGRITDWAIVEASLTPTPAEAHRTSATALKSLMAQIAFESPSRNTASPEGLIAKEDDDIAATGESGRAPRHNRNSNRDKRVGTMAKNNARIIRARAMERLLAARKSAQGRKMEEEFKSEDEYLRSLEEEFKAEFGDDYMRQFDDEFKADDEYMRQFGEDEFKADDEYVRQFGDDEFKADDEYLRSLEEEMKAEFGDDYVRQFGEDEFKSDDEYMRQFGEDEFKMGGDEYLRSLDEQFKADEEYLRNLEAEYGKQLESLDAAEKAFLGAGKTKSALRVRKLRSSLNARRAASVKAIKRRMGEKKRIKAAVLSAVSRTRSEAQRRRTPVSRVKAAEGSPSVDTVVAQVMARIEGTPPVSRVKAHRSPSPMDKGIAMISPTSKYSRLSHEDMSFLAQVMQTTKSGDSGRARTWRPSPDFVTEYAAKALSAVRDGSASFTPSAIKSLTQITATKSLNASTVAGFGDEFVAEGWRAQIWEKPRIANVVAGQVNFIPMPNDPYRLPIESSDPVVYAVPQTINENQLTLADANSPIPDSRLGTENTTLTSGKLGLRVGVAEELNEDSIIPVAQLWRNQAVRAMEDARDFVLLNADSASGTTNINNNGATASATAPYSYGGGDGMIKAAFAGTNLTVDMGGAFPTLSKLREMRLRLGRAMINDLGNLAYFVDPVTYVRILQLDELNVFFNNGQYATVLTGEVGRIDNIPVYVTNEIRPAASDGKVSSTSSNNTLGRVLLIHKPSWIAGYRREIRTSFEYKPEYDAWMLVVTMRMALVKRANDTASLLFNILN